MKEIKITEIENIKIGQVENMEAATGCTVLISEDGMYAGVDVRGGGPASRDTDLLNPLTGQRKIYGIVLSGGSAFGLGASNGVMKCLEERDIGYDVGVTKVPLVVQSDIFDLSIGDAFTRPDPEMGYEAARIALDSPNYKDGSFGAGAGATVGKFLGIKHATKSGIGSYAVKIGPLEVGAVVVLNAWGDVYNWRTGKQIAGLRNEDGTGFRCTAEAMRSNIKNVRNSFVNNTTLAVIITNAAFDKPSLSKIAGMAHDGFARSIRPVHTMIDGDSAYAVSVGEVEADINLIGDLAAEVVSEAIVRAIESAESLHGIPAAKDVK